MTQTRKKAKAKSVPTEIHEITRKKAKAIDGIYRIDRIKAKSKS